MPPGKETVWTARRALLRLGPGGRLDDMLAALRQVAPVATAFVERYREGEEANGCVTPILVPRDYVESMMCSRPHDASVLSIVSSAHAGAVLQDRAVLAAEAWRDVHGYVALERFGMFHPLAVKLASRGVCEAGWHTYLALFGEDPRRPANPEECDRLAALHCDIGRALRRVRLPFTPDEPLFSQIAREQHMGMLAFTRDGRLVAVNGRAWTLAERFARARQLPGRDAVRDLAERLLQQEGPGEWMTTLSDVTAPRSSIIVVSRHCISAVARSRTEDIILLLLREIASPAETDGPRKRPWSALPRRARQVAELLVDGGKPYKQLADEVGISEGTFRKHVERLYRALGVTSRAELTALDRGHAHSSTAGPGGLRA